MKKINQVEIRAWPLRVPASSYKLIEETEKLKEKQLEELKKVKVIQMQAEKDGYRLGLKRGIDEVLAKFRSKLEKIDAETAALKEELLQQLPQLASGFCRKILQNELESKPEKIKDIAAGFIVKIKLSQKIVFYYNLDDSKYIEEFTTDLKDSYPEISFQKSERSDLAPGELMLESGNLTIDGRFKTFQKSFFEHLKKGN
ncbi:MAG: FliH/SctL family protein [Deltaproteobacteria bacterium]|jgi:flagellar biosynthesis/type III secretory pathway protein FliH|nr:FliH/SctL family protein [Deltaproteobacteria bacterium]